MPDHPELPDTLAVHIRAAARPDGESARLTRAVLDGCWPGGSHDRTEPVARGWLRMWGPVKVVVSPPRCGCQSGRCTICN